MKKQPDANVYAQKKERLIELLELDNQGAIDLIFTDECGFSLTPSIPYAWQPIGETRTIRSAKDRVINVFGLLNRSGKLKTYSTSNNINSDFIIECIDEVALSIEMPTVLVFDNAPWHTSDKVKKKQKEWEEKNLFIFFLPTYSPHLNLIEILWRKIKYEWLRPEHYESAKNLKNAIFHIIRQYDNEFSINFSKNFNL